MVTFDSRSAGTPAAEWRKSPLVLGAASLGMKGIGRAVVVAAHPDDESLGAGGLMASLARHGADLTVVFVTDGAASHPNSGTHSREQIAAMRRDEGKRAIRALASTARTIFLDVGDGATPLSRDDIRSRIAEQVADADLLVAPWRGDGHRDHRVVGEVCAAVAAEQGIRLLEYPIWMWHWGSPLIAELAEFCWVGHELDRGALDAKRQAILAYVSQIDGLGDEPGDGPMLTTEFLAHFDEPRELFIETRAAARQLNELGEPYFDDLYRRRSDPWRLESRWYERRKRAITMSALPAERYASALEVGTSIGMLTGELAERCDSLLSIDISLLAVEQARERVSNRDNVRVEHRDAVHDFPHGQFDLIVISEVGYYWTRELLEDVAASATASLSADGILVLCHWRHAVDGYLLSGDEVHRIVRECVDLDVVVSHEEDDFRLDVLSRDPRSVAQREGFIS